MAGFGEAAFVVRISDPFGDLVGEEAELFEEAEFFDAGRGRMIFNSRFSAGMTAREARATTKATATKTTEKEKPG